MYDKLVGYLLGALDPDESARVQQSVQADTDSRHQLEVLRHALEPLEGDREPVAAPEGLAAQTCQRILQQQRERRTESS